MSDLLDIFDTIYRIDTNCKSILQVVTSIRGTQLTDRANQVLFEARALAALATLSSQMEQTMALIDDINAALTNLQSQVSAVATDLQNFAADLAAALSSNDTAAAQAALTGINQAASALQAAVAANQAPAPTGGTGATGATGATGTGP